MKSFILLTFLIAMTIVSCYSPSTLTNRWRYYEYHYSMVAPTHDTSLLFENDTLNVKFDITASEINFDIKNKLSDPFKIIWDDASVVMFGENKKIIHKGVKYIDRSNAMPATSIPGGVSWSDLVVPADNIYYREGTYSQYVSVSGGWETKPLYPNYLDTKSKDNIDIQSFVGQEMELYLPIKFNEKEVYYRFKFKVEDIQPLSKPKA